MPTCSWTKTAAVLVALAAMPAAAHAADAAKAPPAPAPAASGDVAKLGYAPGVTDANAASEASIRELFAVTETRQLADRAWQQADTMMRRAAEQATQGRTLSPAQREAVDRSMQRLTDLFKTEFRWDRMEPMFMEVYRRTFTQQEVDGMLAFYRSPAGRAVVTKMPVVQQYSMELVQTQLRSLMPKVQQIQREMMAELQKPAGGS